MLNRHYIFGMSCLLMSSSLWANHLEDEITSNQPISALNLLQSLHDLPMQQNLTVPTITEFYTPQQVRTLFAAAPQLPIVDIQLTFNAGSARDESIAKGLFGLSHLTAQLINQGTPQQDTAQIAAAFANVGAQFSAQAYRDMFIIKLRVRSDQQYLQPALQQLVHLLMQANFPQESLDRLFNNVVVGQKQIKESPARSMSVSFYRSLYGQHPYAEPTTGTVKSLKSIHPEHLQAFKHRYLVNRNLNIAITGDLNQQQATDLATIITQSLPYGETAETLVDAKPLTEQKIVILPFNASQAHIMMGQMGIKRTDADRMAMEVGNEILGGSGFTSLLMQALREKRGFTYGVSSQISSMLSQGMFSINYATQQDQLLPSIEVAYQTLLNFIHQPLDPALVELTKTSMLRKFPQNFSNNANLNAQLGVIGFYQFPTNYLHDYTVQIQQVTTEDIQHAWRKHLHPDRLLTVIAGQNVSATQIKSLYQQQWQQQSQSMPIALAP